MFDSNMASRDISGRGRSWPRRDGQKCFIDLFFCAFIFYVIWAFCIFILYLNYKIYDLTIAFASSDNNYYIFNYINFQIIKKVILEKTSNCN